MATQRVAIPQRLRGGYPTPTSPSTLCISGSLGDLPSCLSIPRPRPRPRPGPRPRPRPDSLFRGHKL